MADKKYYITTPIYYVNDKPNIGSAYTTIAADVLARLHRQAGNKTYLLNGKAEHGTKIAESAEKAGRDIQEFVNENSAKFSLTWDRLGIAPDDFIRTTQGRHVEAVKKFFNKLKNSGKVYEADYEGLYCVGCESFKTETELTAEGLCLLHLTKPELLKEKNWFFKLSDYQEILKERLKAAILSLNRRSGKMRFWPLSIKAWKTLPYHAEPPSLLFPCRGMKARPYMFGWTSFLIIVRLSV